MSRWKTGVLISILGSLTGAAGAVRCQVIDDLRLNQIQVIGTHNSYHCVPVEGVRNLISAGGQERALALDYTHRPLEEQFGRLGIRQIELDVYADPEGGKYSRPAARGIVRLAGGDPGPDPNAQGELDRPGFKVLHVPDVDYLSHAATFRGALSQLSAWSAAHPGHVPITVLVEVKDEAVPGVPTRPVPVGQAELEALESEILEVLGKDRLITPDFVRGDGTSLREVVTGRGWPDLNSCRGRVFFALDNDGRIRDQYLALHPELRGAVLFADAGSTAHPAAAWFKRNDPIGGFEEIQGLVRSGFMVRTRADADTREARSGASERRDRALASGAQAISTDYPVADLWKSAYEVRFPGVHVARGNPVSGPPGWWRSELESAAVIAQVERQLAGEAELMLTGGRIVTMDPARPRASALAVRRGRIVAVGSEAELRTLRGDRTRVEDLQGKVVLPGFHDAHAHPGPVYEEESPHASLDLSPPRVGTFEALIALLQWKAARTPKGLPISGRGYRDPVLGRHPTRWDLDKASTEHPIYITHSSGHLGVVNSKALELAGVTRETADPPGGAFDRDAEGNPNGICRERAMSRVRSSAPQGAEPTDAERQAGIVRHFRDLLREGVTSVTVAGTSLAQSRRLRQAAEVLGGPRLHIMVREGEIDAVAALKSAGKLGDAWLSYGTVKLFHGNSLSGRTCWLSEPYADQPDYFGIPPARTQDELDRLISRVHEAGLQAAVHTNGDREIDMVLLAMERAVARAPRADHRHRIEHGSVMPAALEERLAKLRCVLAPHSYLHEHGATMEAYGAWRWRFMHPSRTALDRGIVVAGNSDYPVSAARPLLRIEDLVTRRSGDGKVYGPEQRIGVLEAIETWTWGSAYAAFQEEFKGMLAAGKVADWVVLGEDPAEVAEERIDQIPVLETVIDGHVVSRVDAAPRLER
jgi:predicted amidohydrolase YtcJ